MIVDFASFSDRIVFTLASWSVAVVFFYIHGWFFVCADWYGFLDKWSIRSISERATPVQQWAAIKEASIDTLLLKPLAFYFFYPHACSPGWGLQPLWSDVPDISKMALDWVLMESLFSLTFFLAHGTLHYFPFL
jgi:hypothetical protein